jgi:hypothetical protein
LKRGNVLIKIDNLMNVRDRIGDRSAAAGSHVNIDNESLFINVVVGLADFMLDALLGQLSAVNEGEGAIRNLFDSDALARWFPYAHIPNIRSGKI